MIKDVWHYPGTGDFPMYGQLVWVQAVSLAPWALAVTKSEPSGNPICFQTESMFGGKDEASGLAIWTDLSCHDVVVAWREHEAPGNKQEIRRATEMAQREAAKNDGYLFLMLASALGMNPQRMKPLIVEKMKKFKRRIQQIGESAFVNEDTPVGDFSCPDYYDEARGLVFVVEEYCGCGVIKQAKKGESESRYAWDFPRTRRIYPTTQEAAAVLIAEAERQKWRRAG